ncbi:Uncharacterised protein [Mycobacterium tuberculosis]|nr:Uncharacterised protein [Mycobacterium tuberculosis]
MTATICASGAILRMSEWYAMASLPRSCAADITAVEPVWKATTSAFWLNSAIAASRSFGGSNHSLSHTTCTLAPGFTERMPSVKALMPCSTSGIGKPAT